MRKANCKAEGIKAITARKDYALSRKTHHRPEFRRMIANALESDYVAVCMFDRFGLCFKKCVLFDAVSPDEPA